MSAGFTPGPWAYRPEEHDDWGVVRAGRFHICQARDPEVWSEEQLAEHRRNKTDPWKANANLIAAAPELYEALTEALDMIVDASRDGSYSLSAFDGLKATLAKARGEA